MPLNVLQIISKNDRYGAQRIFLDQVSILHQFGNTVTVVCRGSEGYVTESVARAGIPCAENGMSGLGDIFSLRQLVKLFKIDVIHTALDRADYFGLLASLGKGCPWISTMMVPRFHHGFRFADRVVVLSKMQQDILIGRGINPGKIRLIRPGIDLKRFLRPDEAKLLAWKRKLKSDSHGPVLCHVSSVIPRKSHDVSLDLTAALKEQGENPLLVIIGDPLRGDYYESLRQKIAMQGLADNVIFTGWTADVAEIMSLSHFTVLPSENEALGVVLMEGMAAGTPVVAREREGGAELIEQYKTGFLYKPSEGVAPLAEKIRDCYRDRAGYEQLSARCRNIAEQDFSMERFGKKIMETYAFAGATAGQDSFRSIR